MKRILVTLVLGALSVAPVPAFAKDPVFVASKPIADKPVVTLDPALGYVLVRSTVATPLHLMKIPSTEDLAAYDRMRADALAKEKKKFPGKVSAYQRDLQTYEAIKKSNSAAKKPEPPVEPTNENFVYPAFGLLAGTSIGPLNRFTKGEGGSSTYLQSITPGAYRVYGLLSAVLGAAGGGMCFCMGSVKFTVRAGEITNLGTLEAGTIVPAEPNSGVDARLAGYVVRAAEYAAVGKLPNYFGVTLSRMGPIPGVLAYNRDNIINLTATSAEGAKASGVF